MASSLLYESWLCGLPTLSLQPYRRAESLLRFSRLKGIDWTDDETIIPEMVTTWLKKAELQQHELNPEFERHLSAPTNIVTLVEQLSTRT
jgi:hypothetical protein